MGKILDSWNSIFQWTSLPQHCSTLKHLSIQYWQRQIFTYKMHQTAWKFRICFSIAPTNIHTKTPLSNLTLQEWVKVLKEIRQMAKVGKLKYSQFSHMFFFIIFLDLSKPPPRKSAFFAYAISPKRRATQRKKLQNNVFQVKRNPHGKIQLFLSTFKNSRKLKGTF